MLKRKLMRKLKTRPSESFRERAQERESLYKRDFKEELKS